MKKIIVWSSVFVGLSIALFIAWDWTVTDGREAIHEIAVKHKLCKDDLCQEGMGTVRKVFAKRYGVSAELADWCIGVDGWANAKVYRGGLVKSAVVYLMSLPCGSSEEDTGVQKIDHPGK